MTREDVVELVRKLAGESIGTDPERIGDETLLFEDDGGSLGGDSLDRAELAMAIEEELDLDIPSADIRAHFKSVCTIVDYLATKGKGGSDVRGL